MLIPDHIQLIVFDAFGTLFDVASLDRRLSELLGDKASQINEVWRRKQLEYTWLRTLMGEYKLFSEVTADALTFACRSQHIALKDAEREYMVQGYFELAAFQGLHKQLRALGQKYKLAILSNADPAMLDSAVKANQLEAYFEAVMSADSVRLFKPRPEVYQIACRQFALRPGEVAFISSNTWDVAGAGAFGFFNIWLNRGSQSMDILSHPPSLEIGDMQDL